MTTARLHNTPADIAAAAALLRAGACVALPTETVYGLAANALDADAVRGIFAAKGRPADNPLIVHLLCAADAVPLVAPGEADKLTMLGDFMPGPLTVILRRAARVPSVVSGGLDSVALRIPAHPVARAVLAACGLPLAAPSANRSGSPSPTSAQHVLDDLDGAIAAVLDGGESAVGVESTVLSLTGDVPEILRPGAVTPEQLCALLGEVRVAEAVLAPLSAHTQAASPGMKYKHYAPRLPVVLVRGSAENYAAWCNARACLALCFARDAQFLRVPVFCYGAETDAETQARLLFDGLRTLDTAAAALQDAGGAAKLIIAAHAPAPNGVGLAVYNRLLRAAGFAVVEV